MNDKTRDSVRWFREQPAFALDLSPSGREGGLQPLDRFTIDGDNVESARGQLRQRAQEMLGRKHDAALFGTTNACGCATMRGGGSLPYFNENQRAVTVAANQINFAAASARPCGDPIIAPDQAHAPARHMRQRQRFRGVAHNLGCRFSHAHD